MKNAAIIKNSDENACCEHCAEKTDFSGFAGEPHDHDHGGSGKIERNCAITGAVLFAVGMVLTLAGVAIFEGIPKFILFLIAYILVGGPVLLKAVKGIARGQVFDENFLMAIASIGAFVIGDFPEGVAVMLFYRVGEAFEDMAVDKSKRQVAALMDVRPEEAHLITTDGIVTTAPEKIQIGALIQVRPGERIPLDGTIREGLSVLDTSALTGESLPVDAEPGAEVLAGSVNKSGTLTIEVTREFGESAVARILKLVQEAGARKAPAENFITKFARYYTPIVVLAAVLLAFLPPLVLAVQAGGPIGAFYAASLSEWVNRALIFLVISCPCALVISIPLSYFGGIGGASKAGILVKGGNYLEALARAETVVFDKTGTLTKGILKVESVFPAENISEERLLRTAAFAEQNSTHPIAKAIMSAASVIEASTDSASERDGGLIGIEIGLTKNTSYEEIAGRGVKISTGDLAILAGKPSLLKEYAVDFEEAADIGTVVYVASLNDAKKASSKGGVKSMDTEYLGRIVLADEPKSDAKEAVSALKKMGIKKIAMLSGDADASVKKVASALGIDDYRAGLLPDEKVTALEALGSNADKPNAKRGSLVFVGDGINDAPVLARADIGVAMGGIGSDAAVEAADVVLMTDEPSKLAKAITIAKRTQAIAIQNIVFALAVKGVLLVLGALGMASMWAAVFGDVGVALIAVLNALRALRV